MKKYWKLLAILLVVSGCAYAYGGDLITGNFANIYNQGLTASQSIFSDANKKLVSKNAADARSALGTAASGTNSDITSLSGLTTPLSIAQGGGGANTAAGIRSALSAAQSGVNNDITSLGTNGGLTNIVTKGPWVDVRSCGATTSSSDNSAAIQSCVTNNAGKAIFFPEVYQIATTITATSATAVVFKGLGINVSGLYSTANISLLKFDTTAGDIYHADVSGLTFQSNVSGTRTSTMGIQISGTYALRRSNINHCLFSGNYYGIYAGTTGVSDWNTFDNLLFGNYAGYGTDYGIFNNNSLGQHIISNSTFITTNRGIYMSGGFGDFTIIGNNFDGGNGSYCIELQSTDLVYHSNFAISGNKFDSYASRAIVINWGSGFRVIGNAYSGLTTVPVLVCNCTSYVYDVLAGTTGFVVSY